MRSIPRKSETLGNRPWRMGWPSAKARERGGGGGWAQPTRPLPGGARQRACSRARALALERRRRPPAQGQRPGRGERSPMGDPAVP